MKRILNILLVTSLVFFAVVLWAQDANKKDAKVPEKKKLPKVAVYLGHSNLTGGKISKTLFDSLLKQGLTSKDSSGNDYKVVNFMFTYAELNLYEDSVGKLMFMTDYRSEFCPGDTITENIAGSLYQRTKVGDTLYFDQITVRRASDNAGGDGKPMRFEITSK